MLDLILSLMLVAFLLGVFCSGFVLGFKSGKTADTAKTAMDALKAVLK